VQKELELTLSQAEKLKQEFFDKERILLSQIKKESGMDVEIWEARSIAKAFDKLKVEYPRTEKTKEPKFYS
jgi:hypothetical protein